MKYVMVTDLANHWDKLEGGFTSYSRHMLMRGLSKAFMVDGTETIFIKRKPYSKAIERCWIGKVKDIQVLPGNVFFRADIEKEISCPAEYASYPSGWYFRE